MNDNAPAPDTLIGHASIKLPMKLLPTADGADVPQPVQKTLEHPSREGVRGRIKLSVCYAEEADDSRSVATDL